METSFLPMKHNCTFKTGEKVQEVCVLFPLSRKATIVLAAAERGVELLWPLQKRAVQFITNAHSTCI